MDRPSTEHRPLLPATTPPALRRPVTKGLLLASLTAFAFFIAAINPNGRRAVDPSGQIVSDSERLAATTTLEDDDYTAYQMFFKWTFTSGSPELVLENREAMWMGLGFYKFDRVTSLDTFMTVGPTGCRNASAPAGHDVEVARGWVTPPFTTRDVGGNEIHWVYDVSANNEASVELPVKAWHEALTKARAATLEDQFADQRQSYYAPWADEFVKSLELMADKFGYHIELIRGSSDMPSRECFVIVWANNDGQIFELVAPRLKDATLATRFKKIDRCLFRPLAAFARYDKVLGTMKGLDVGQMCGDACGSLRDDPEIMDNDDDDDEGVASTVDATALDGGGDDAQQPLDGGGDDAQQPLDGAGGDDAQQVGGGGEPASDDDPILTVTTSTLTEAQSKRRSQLPGVMPMATQLASTAPATDAAFFTSAWDRSSTHTPDRETPTRAEARAWEAHGATCDDVQSEWVLLNSTHAYEPHYLHLAYHADYAAIPLGGARPGSMTLAKYEAFLGDLRADMAKNVYDVYMDDHWGINTWQASGSTAGYFGPPGPTDLAAMALGLYKDGAALLTRREPEGSMPTLYQKTGVEEFSVFFTLPVSKQVTQVFSTGTEQFRLKDLGLPTFCDWDFCDLNGWRSKNEDKHLEPVDCGFSMPGFREPGTRDVAHDDAVE